MSVFSFLDVTASAATYTLSLHDALPISVDLAGNQETTKSALMLVNSFKGFACATQPFALAALPSSATVIVSGTLTNGPKTKPFRFKFKYGPRSAAERDRDDDDNDNDAHDD